MNVFKIMLLVLALAAGTARADDDRTLDERIAAFGWIVQSDSYSGNMRITSSWNCITGESIFEVTNYFSHGSSRYWFDNSGLWNETIEYVNNMVFISGLNQHEGFYFRSFERLLD